ncbi:unnamed protein product [Rotaria magnacalcarata]|uniref:UDP-glucose 6-dehydrogenase n=2 Tax=Rotaria magnacalcarata TaxID=392030 RepID=A0A815ZDZ8_9BILA|nr:unnamed protein product [Rotaria magnacalcarata]CAF1663560.1 unnamed protein product [Rotaria magnacalcarata]CAF3974575.1 unnamed protein product [Rotaria magnacalcarata]
MMKIGMIGLGKLGMPVALGMNMKGHDVMGYDLNPNCCQTQTFPHREMGPNQETSIEPLLQKSSIKFGSLEEVVDHAEIIFIAVQTPHDPEYEGITRIPKSRKNFDYTWLVSALEELSRAVEKKGEDRVIIVISTVLPGTIRKHVLPKLGSHIKLCYNPFFIAMGTTIRDFYNPEFILFGVHDSESAKKAETFYKTITDAPFYLTTIENAEMIKVSYNTYIGMKIVFGNTLMEICHKLPHCDVDIVTNALSLGGRRLMSGAYLRGGMGDGGGCHPRDNIALSWLAGELKLKHDFYSDIMQAREDQTEWLADLIVEYNGDKIILGKSFKPETNLTVGSPSLLLRSLLEERNVKVLMWDPHVDGMQIPEFAKLKAVYFIGTQHTYFQSFPFAAGSVVLDPFRYIPDQIDVRIIQIGSAKTGKF